MSSTIQNSVICPELLEHLSKEGMFELIVI